MRIIELRAENIKALKAVRIQPTGDLVQVTGKNGAGKSSVLDSIYWALAGTRSHQSQPVRRGQKSAEVVLDLGKFIVERKFARSKKDADRVTTSLGVKAKDGAVYGEPQRILTDMLGPLAFDPLEFTRATPAERLRQLCEAAGIDLAEAEAADRRDVEERRVANREARDARAAASSIEAPDEEPPRPKPIRDLTDERRQMQLGNQEIAQERAQREHQRRNAETLEATALERRKHADETEEAAQAEAARLIAAAQEIATKLRERSAADIRGAQTIRDELDGLPDLPEPADLDAIDRQIEENDARRSLHEAWNRRRDLLDMAEASESRAKGYDKALRERADTLTAAVQNAMPVPGLQLGSGSTLMVDGLGFDVLNDALKLQISCAVAMAQNSELRVIRVRDGSLLDSESLKVLEKMAAEHDYQIWIERVDESGSVGFVIEDGEVRDPSDGLRG